GGPLVGAGRNWFETDHQDPIESFNSATSTFSDT
ncbi:MAG: hypothetical protein ACI9AF_001860, partial [Granulosicoccus sp.]